jgi:hypothetical protein
VAATYCIDYRVVLSCVPACVNSNEDVTMQLYLYVQQVPRLYHSRKVLYCTEAWEKTRTG